MKKSVFKEKEKKAQTQEKTMFFILGKNLMIKRGAQTDTARFKFDHTKVVNTKRTIT